MADLQCLIAQTVSFFQEQQLLMRNIVERNDAPPGQRMRGIQGQNEGLFEEKLAVQPFVRHRQCQYRGIQSPGPQARQYFLGFFFHQQQFQQREACLNPGQHMRQKIGRQRRENAHAQCPCARLLGTAGDSADTVGALQDFPRLRQYGIAGLRKQYFARCTLDQYRAEFVLELLELRR